MLRLGSFQRSADLKAVVADFNSQLLTASPSKMFSRSALSRGAQLAARRQGCSQLAQRRGYAAASSAPSTFTYDTTEVAGIKVATRDLHGPTTKLAVVAKGGTRYQPAPGLTVGLEEFAFKVSESTSLIVVFFRRELIRCNYIRTPKSEPPYVSREKLSF